VDLGAATSAGLQTIISMYRESGNNPNWRSKQRHAKTLRDYAVECGGFWLFGVARALYPVSSPSISAKSARILPPFIEEVAHWALCAERAAYRFLRRVADIGPTATPVLATSGGGRSFKTDFLDTQARRE